MWPFTGAPKADDIPTFAAENTIGATTVVTGDLRGGSGFRIDGTVEGAIETDGPVVVGERGTVDGSIQASQVIVLGRIRGDVHVADHLEIGPRGQIVGDVTVKSFRMHKGGVFRGMSRMHVDGIDHHDGHLLGAHDEGPEVERVTAYDDTSRPRARTLPPIEGAVPPPASGSGGPGDAVSSQKRLVTHREDEDEPTGT